MPQRWHGRAQFTVLHCGAGRWTANFLAALRAWRDDPQRCTRLDFVAVDATPQHARELVQAVLRSAGGAALEPLARELAARYPLPLPGLHRIEFGLGNTSRVVLTLAVGDASALLPQLRLAADAIYFQDLPAAAFKSLARLARPDADITVHGAVTDSARKALAEAGFQMAEDSDGSNEADSADGIPAESALQGVYHPAWPRPASWPDNRRAALPSVDPPARRALVIGAGLSGASAAWSLARRGWRVTLLDAAPGPAGGTSGLPAGLMVPHVSPDDAPMSRLTRAGAALMREWIDAIELPPDHWRAGVLQSVDDRHKARAPATWNGLSLFEWRETLACGPEQHAARFFPQGLAIEPAALVRALLAASPGLESRWSSPVASLMWQKGDADDGGQWTALGADGQPLAQAPVVVVAAALDSLRIAGHTEDFSENIPAAGRVLRPVRGQITLGAPPLSDDASAALPTHALSGDGHFVPALRADSPWPWLVGASFERGEITLQTGATAEAGNLEKLARLAPAFAAQVATAQPHGAWIGVRCTSPDRLPLVGALPASSATPGVHVLAALGSRGLSVAAVCAELLACQLNHEPWPIEASLAQALDPARFVATAAAAVAAAAP